MIRFPRRQPIDLGRFDASEPDAAFGLPRQVRFCRSCVISNQRPNSTVEYMHTGATEKKTVCFEDGICDACRAARRKAEIDWAGRERELIDLCDRHRRNDGRYDCVVPGSGGKDSFYAAHVLKYRYGMHPLTVTWAPHIYTDWGWRNFQSWIGAGFDNILTTPNGRVHRLLTRLAVEVLFHPFQPFVIGQKALAPKMSILHDIPLVFYGESEAEYGNPIAGIGQATRDAAFFASDDPGRLFLGGVSVGDLASEFGLEPCDLAPYLPARPDELRRVGTEVRYLGYYLKWHPQSCYYYAVEHGGFEAAPERNPGTYSKYNSIDDRIDDLHYFSTYIKFGIGRATYDAAQETRSGDIAREEAAALVRRFDGEFPERFIGELMAYLSLPAEQFPTASRLFEQPIMDRKYFMHLADRFRSPHLWRRDGDGWKLRHVAWEDREKCR